MGCRLPKLRKAEERRSPGKIYSTLRRPQVETKVGVAYTYHFLDFLLGKEEVPVSSVLCLSSVRELPVQVRELYSQGFVLVAVHPFVHPCGPRHARIQRQLHRAVLVRETQSSEKTQLKWAGHRLETDVCVAGHQEPDPEVIQNYVKRIQDVAEQGVMFVGFLQQPGGGPCFTGQWDPEELSSLHSTPSPVHRHPYSASTSPTEPNCNFSDSDRKLLQSKDLDPSCADDTAEAKDSNFAPLTPAQDHDFGAEKLPEQKLEESTEDTGRQYQNQNQPPPSPETTSIDRRSDSNSPKATKTHPDSLGESEERLSDPHLNFQNGMDREQCSSPESWVASPELHHRQESNTGHLDGQNRMTTHNNNHIRDKGSEKEKPSAITSPVQTRVQLFALYNHTGEMNSSLRFYSLRVPLGVQREAGLITEVEAHWLDHMTEHFTKGAHLIDGFFHLGEDNDNGVSSVDSVFIFQSSAEENITTSYDAIVVEQWTIVDGVVVRTDYIPLLQSLAPYGWRLMSVLPTPIVKTNSDGSLSTKQILFLQRPTLQRKRKDFKMPNLRGRNKAKKNSTGDVSEKERGNTSPVTDRGMDGLQKNMKGEEEEEEEDEGREGARIRENGKSEGACPQRCGGQRRGEAEHQTDPSLQKVGGGLGENQEDETEIDRIPLAKMEKMVRWTDVCQREDGGGVKTEVKTEERIKQQLSDRALFSGVC